MHFTRDDILRMYAESNEFSIHLAAGDTAWDPETGDTLLGPAVIVYALGKFPGPPLTATINPGWPSHGTVAP